MIRHDAALQEKSPPLVEKEKRNLNINAAIARGGGGGTVAASVIVRMQLNFVQSSRAAFVSVLTLACHFPQRKSQYLFFFASSLSASFIDYCSCANTAPAFY